MTIIKYEGNEKVFIGLFKDEENKLFVLYALTEGLNLNCEEEDFTINMNYDIPCEKIVIKKNFFLNIPILYNLRNNTGFTLIQIADEEQYELVKTVVKSLL